MQVPPSLASVKAALYAAAQNAVQASYVHGVDAVEALRSTRNDVRAAVGTLHALCPAEPTACAVLQAIEGQLTRHIDTALRIARHIDPVDGVLPVGTVDPVFVDLEQAADILSASRWG